MCNRPLRGPAASIDSRRPGASTRDAIGMVATGSGGRRQRPDQRQAAAPRQQGTNTGPAQQQVPRPAGGVPQNKTLLGN